ncbi:MAG: DUF1501 domain-containing protein [Rhodobacteraceae bacterium]|nr:DUF1501 domain-containing protein [Paracoccaceae bacterium]
MGYVDRSRRRFLAKTLAIGCSAAASPLVTPVTFASVNSDKRLVVIVLRGGMDGLDVVAPVGDPLLAQYRPNVGAASHSDLDGFFALHPKLSGLMPMWQSGELAFVHAVSTPYRNKRSHFDGQDILEAGVAEINSDIHDSGWINRMLAQMPGAGKETAFSVGRESMLLLRGDLPMTSWSPEGRIDLSPQAQLMLDVIYQKDPLFAEAGSVALTLAAQLNLDIEVSDDDQVMMRQIMKNMQAANRFQRATSLAAFAANRLREDTRIAAFSIGGWDTHRKQTSSIKKALGQLQAALTTLKSELGQTWEKTAVVCMTEFGRTVRENGSAGTDHGTGGAMVLAGGLIRGRRVYGDWPGLRDDQLFKNRDLMPTSDVRRYTAWMIRDLYGISASELEAAVFPGLDMGGNPKVIS